MKINKNPRTNWLLDLVIMTVFLLTFFLNLTGLPLHQWLGILLFALTIGDLLIHADWVNRFTRHFFTKATHRTTGYAVLDILIFGGFFIMVYTGLAISTWLNLELVHYDTWYGVHVYVSLGALGLVVLKLGLHWRWIALNTTKLLRGQQPITQQIAQPTAGRVLSRRQFISTMGVVGFAAAVAIGNVVPSLLRNISKEEDPTPEEGTASPTPKAVAVQEATTSTETAETLPTNPPATSEPENNLPTSTPTPQPVQEVAQAPVVESALVCTQRCPHGRHCSYPGRCNLYQDINSNGLCDLGECS